MTNVRETAATAGVSITPGRPAQARRTTGRVVACLFVDFGDRDRAPRARYECVRCGYASPIVTGPAAVKTFVDTAADTHRAVCTAPQETHQ